jgi:hypothetical protein
LGYCVGNRGYRNPKSIVFATLKERVRSVFRE